MNDPISDMIARIKNALAVGKASVDVPYSAMKENILVLLRDEGYIRSFDVLSDKNLKYINIALKYYANAPVIAKIKRVSKPGCRTYSPAKMLRAVNGGLGMLVLSTSHGIISDAMAKERNIGGEVLFEVF